MHYLDDVGRVEHVGGQLLDGCNLLLQGSDHLDKICEARYASVPRMHCKEGRNLLSVTPLNI